ncbi:unnamed protein product, partial [Didymodactylos carnosus]
MEPDLAHSVSDYKSLAKFWGKSFYHRNHDKVNSGLPYTNQGAYEAYSSQDAVSGGYDGQSGSIEQSGLRRSPSGSDLTKTFTGASEHVNVKHHHHHRSKGRRHHHDYHSTSRRHHSYVGNTDFGQKFIFTERDGCQSPPLGYEYRGKFEVKRSSTKYVYRSNVSQPIRYIQTPPSIQQVPVPYIQLVPVPKIQKVQDHRIQ